jgi:hypothetical protein
MALIHMLCQFFNYVHIFIHLFHWKCTQVSCKPSRKHRPFMICKTLSFLFFASEVNTEFQQKQNMYQQ